MNLEQLKSQALESLKAIKNLTDLENWKVKYLGRKSELSLFLRSLAGRSLEEKRALGAKANQLRKELRELNQQKQSAISNKQLVREVFDITLPGKKQKFGRLHPLTLVSRQIVEIFASMGFDIVCGPEIESEYYNFDALNIPEWHPARDSMDTFWLNLPRPRISNEKFPKNKGLLLRTHTSPMQARYMQTHKPPFRMIVAEGKVFRNEATDARHEFQFWQTEGLMVGEDISLGTLKYVLEEFFKRFFGEEIKTKFAPSYFPFVEPGLEVGITCIMCSGKTGRCRLCGGSGWLEILGAGMVHPNVLKGVGINTRKNRGLAFGVGFDRLAILKYGINDIRLFQSGDLRLVKQF
jgi:phenylalanyl-tRNA synthetase alpha chain